MPRSEARPTGGQRAVPRGVEGVLDAGEEPVIFVRARVQRRRTGGDTWVGIHVALALIDLVWSARAIRHLSGQTAELGFPLSRRMGILVTSSRVLVWDDWSSQANAPVAFPRRNVVAAGIPFVSQGARQWRTASVDLTNGCRVFLQVEGDQAQAFVDALTA